MLPKPTPLPPPANPPATPKCPRCDSPNTKFCYYNNYSLSQPRHFCKSCKRYWTRGGTLRNVPVGGGTRKNKRAKKHSRPSISAAAAGSPSVPPPPTTDISPSFFPAINSVLLPKFDVDAQFSGFDHKSAFHGHYCLPSGSQLHSEGYQTSPALLFSYDGIPVMEPLPPADSSYFYWNQPEAGGWPPAGSSTAPLF